MTHVIGLHNINKDYLVCVYVKCTEGNGQLSSLTFSEQTEVGYSENRNQESMEPEAFPQHSDVEVQDHQHDAVHKKDVRTEHSTPTSEYSYILLLFLFFYYSNFHTCTFFYICKNFHDVCSL